MVTTDERIDSVITRINDRYGDQGKANRGSEEPPIRRISTRSLELDYATGGGVPVGRMSRFYGGPSTGKSIKAQHVIAEAQSMGMTCAYVNAEKQYTDEFSAMQGVDTDKLVVVQTSIIEDIGEIIEGNLDEIDVWVIDSCSFCITRDELAAGLNEKELPMIRARRWGTQFSFINERFDRNRNVLLYIDQLRVKNAMGGFTSEGPPGGKLMEFASSMTIEFKRGPWLWYNKDGVLTDTRNTKQKTLSQTLEADGYGVNAQVVKSRVCRPLRTAAMKFDYASLSFDHIDEYAKAAKYFEVVESSPGWIKYDDRSVRPSEFKEILAADSELRDRIRTAALAKN